MSRAVSFALIVLVLLSFAAYGVLPASAALPKGCVSTYPCFYGYVKSNGAAIYGATIKAYPRPGSAPVTITSGSDGYYALNIVVSGPYAVGAVKYGYTFSQTAEISLNKGQQYRLDFSLSARSIQTARVFVVSDQQFRALWGSGNWQAAASAILAGGANYWQLYYSLSFQIVSFYAWTAPVMQKVADLKVKAEQGTGWSSGNYRGASFMLYLTGQALDMGGLANVPLWGGSHPSALVSWRASNAGGPGDPNTLLLMHEFGHLYGLLHTTSTYYSVMRYENFCCIATFAPAEESVVNSHRSWY